MKNAIVTGGTGGIGAATCRALAAEGYRVGILDLDATRTEELAKAIPNAVALDADVTSEAAVAAAVEKFGAPVDLLVNNAGVVQKGTIMGTSIADFRRVMEINLIGALIVTRAVARDMIVRKAGVIINTTSIAAVVPNSNGGAYGPSKAALANLTEIMALEFAEHGIRVNSVAPGMIAAGMAAGAVADPAIKAARESMVPMGRLGLAEEIADAICFLASGRASYLHGHQLVVDGAVTKNVLAQLPIKKV